MSIEDVEKGLAWLEGRFHVIKYVKVWFAWLTGMTDDMLW